MVVGVYCEAKPLTSMSMKPKRDKKGLESHDAFQGYAPNDLKTFHLAPLPKDSPPPPISTTLGTKPLNTWDFGGYLRPKL
jgi:hypothetical protein